MFNPLMGEELARLIAKERQEAIIRNDRASTGARASFGQEHAVRHRLGFAVVRVGERIAGNGPQAASTAKLPA